MQGSAPRTDAPLRVLIVDADQRVRESLAGLLSIGGRVTVVGGAGDAPSALELVTSTAPEVVIVDPRMPDIEHGLRFLDRLRKVAPAVRVVAMGGSDAAERIALDGRADGFVRKTFRPSELIAAIEAAGAPVAG